MCLVCTCQSLKQTSLAKEPAANVIKVGRKTRIRIVMTSYFVIAPLLVLKHSTTLQSVMNIELNLLRVWPWHENKLIEANSSIAQNRHTCKSCKFKVRLPWLLIGRNQNKSRSERSNLKFKLVCIVRYHWHRHGDWRAHSLSRPKTFADWVVH